MDDKCIYYPWSLSDICLPCSLRQHEECDYPSNDSCCCGDSTQETTIVEIGSSGDSEKELRDVISTGRKRAAQLKPIIENMTCEWANLLYAGGGVIPIVGCNGIKLTKEKGRGVNTGNIHHGPDKSTLNNSDENLHRICGQCHNRWHTLNDPYYGDRPPNGAPFLPIELECKSHDKYTLASEKIIKLDSLWWATPKEQRKDSTYRNGYEDE